MMQELLQYPNPYIVKKKNRPISVILKKKSTYFGKFRLNLKKKLGKSPNVHQICQEGLLDGIGINNFLIFPKTTFPKKKIL